MLQDAPASLTHAPMDLRSDTVTTTPIGAARGLPPLLPNPTVSSAGAS